MGSNSIDLFYTALVCRRQSVVNIVIAVAVLSPCYRVQNA